jgi:cysteine desulfurase
MHPAAIYLDHNATTPLDPEVLEAMRPHFLSGGNAESRHAFGRAARCAWERARDIVASILGADPAEVIFTSGGTEANNLAIFGLAGAQAEPAHVVASPIEHPAIAEPLARLEAAGFAVDRIPVTKQGVADARQMATALQSATRFATLMLANNETGAIQPVAELAVLAAAQDVPVHTDAVQAVGRIPVHFGRLGTATLAASAHKFHGPVGVGLLLVQRHIRLGSRLFGGGQQQGRRPGTVPVALVVGLATALQRWHNSFETCTARWTAQRDHLYARLVAALGPHRIIRNGPDDESHRLPQTLNVGFPDIDGDALLMHLDLTGVAVSLGAACASGSTRPSPTLLAMRVPDSYLRSSVRFSFGLATTMAELDDAIERIVEVLRRLDSAQSSLALPSAATK